MTDNPTGGTNGGNPGQRSPRRGARPQSRHRNERPPKKKIHLVRRVGAVIVVLAVIVGLYVAWEKTSDWLSGPDDYTGQGGGQSTIRIDDGDSGKAIAKTLQGAGVVKSMDAFYQVLITSNRSKDIQPGVYRLQKHVPASRALTELLDPASRVQGKVVIREGARVDDIVSTIVKNTDLTKKSVVAALHDPAAIGLPKGADDNPEGYLFPATYTIEPDTSATAVIKRMVAKTVAVEEELDISKRAKSLGFSAEQILTVASILEYEAKRPQDYSKVARVLYNRLDKRMALQLDSTVTYVSKRKGDVFTTAKERANESAYNTYKHTGLPPGPIGSPGKKTIEAALNPSKGDWLYFVAVNLDTGKTVFSDTLAEHNKAKKVLDAYCRKSSSC